MLCVIHISFIDYVTFTCLIRTNWNEMIICEYVFSMQTNHALLVGYKPSDTFENKLVIGSVHKFMSTWACTT